MDNKKLISIVGIAILLAIVVGFWFWSQRKTEESIEPIESVEPVVKEKGVVETAKDVSESVPEIETNVGESVPETNPLDRANPYKYTNPLR